MSERSACQLVVTGIGITSALGQGKVAFTPALLSGRHNFAVMRRPGRQLPPSMRGEGAGQSLPFIGAEIGELSIPEPIPRHLLRTASFSGQVALATVYEAWHEAKLDDVDPTRIGLIIGGSNLQQRELVQTYEAYRDRPQFLRPTYALSFMDSDLCGLCTQTFGVRGFAHTVGGASASGQVAILQAIQAIHSGQVDVCIALGALMDLSYWECQSFRALGAMGSDRYAAEPALACRPFDRDRDGFIFGESCGAIVIERWNGTSGLRSTPYGRLSGWAMNVDGNRNPNPSLEGEVRAIAGALRRAGLTARDIDYLNPHGTGSGAGDEIELEAIRHCKLDHAYINATKSLIGHGLSAAGVVEAIAVLLQMKERRLHPMRNLDHPCSSWPNWVGAQCIPHVSHNALNLSIGFGGVNSALCLQNINP